MESCEIMTKIIHNILNIVSHSIENVFRSANLFTSFTGEEMKKVEKPGSGFYTTAKITFLS